MFVLRLIYTSDFKARFCIRLANFREYKLCLLSKPAGLMRNRTHAYMSLELLFPAQSNVSE